jgi:hypothetical protein
LNGAAGILPGAIEIDSHSLRSVPSKEENSCCEWVSRRGALFISLIALLLQILVLAIMLPRMSGELSGISTETAGVQSTVAGLKAEINSAIIPSSGPIDNNATHAQLQAELSSMKGNISELRAAVLAQNSQLQQQAAQIDAQASLLDMQAQLLRQMNATALSLSGSASATALALATANAIDALQSNVTLLLQGEQSLSIRAAQSDVDQLLLSGQLASLQSNLSTLLSCVPLIAESSSVAGGSVSLSQQQCRLRAGKLPCQHATAARCHGEQRVCVRGMERSGCNQHHQW